MNHVVICKCEKKNEQNINGNQTAGTGLGTEQTFENRWPPPTQ